MEPCWSFFTWSSYIGLFQQSEETTLCSQFWLQQNYRPAFFTSFFLLLSFSFSFLMVFFVGWLGVISCSYNSVMLIFVVVVVVVVVCLF